MCSCVITYCTLCMHLNNLWLDEKKTRAVLVRINMNHEFVSIHIRKDAGTLGELKRHGRITTPVLYRYR